MPCRLRLVSDRQGILISLALSTAIHLALIALPLKYGLDPLKAYLPPLVVSLPSNLSDKDIEEAPLSAEHNASSTFIPPIKQDIHEISPPPRLAQVPTSLPPVYLPAKELSLKPRLTIDWDELSWRLPPQAHGSVSLTLYISSRGSVDRIEYAGPVSSELHEWIEHSLMKGTPFAPGERNGVPVASRMTVELDLSALRR